MTPEHPVAQWLMQLASLCRIPPEMNIRGSVAVNARLLAEHLPAAAFTPASLEYVARECEWWPAYAVMRRHLSDWWRDNRPTPQFRIGMASEGERYDLEQEAIRASWQDEAVIRAKLAEAEKLPVEWRGCSMRLLRAAVECHAPQHLHLVAL